MKNLFLTLSFTFLFLFSCTKDETENNEVVNTAKIARVTSEKDIDNQKLMYQMLTKEEKHTLWSEKINTLITSGNLSQPQMDLLADLKNQLTVSLFDNNSKNDEKEIFKTIYVRDFLKKARGVFSDEMMYTTFYTTNNYEYSTSRIDTGSGGFELDLDFSGISKPNCTCNIGSMWSCAQGTVATCKSDNCRILPSDCGFFGMFECDGRCKF